MGQINYLGDAILKAANKRNIDPFNNPFKPSDLGLKASDYGSFSDWCSKAETESSKWNTHCCLKVVGWRTDGKPLRYLLLDRNTWQ